MGKIYLTMMMAALVATGCESTDTTGPLTFSSNDLSIVGTDECGFFIENDPLVAVISVVGSTVTMVVQSVNTPEAEFELTAENYDPMQDDVLVTSLSVNTNNDPCVVELDDAMRLTLADPDLSLEEQDSLSVVWNHAEADISTAYDDACTLDEEGNPLEEILWFNDLPCSGQANLTMTLQTELPTE